MTAGEYLYATKYKSVSLYINYVVSYKPANVDGYN